jgi:flagellar assembly factor FliW
MADAHSPVLDNAVIDFPEGLPGFDDRSQFVLLRPPGLHPVLLLENISEKTASLAVVAVEAVDRGYRLTLTPEDRQALGLEEEPQIAKNVLCLAVIVLAAHGKAPTCNLLAPIVINPANRRAKQIIQMESDYSIAHPLTGA